MTFKIDEGPHYRFGKVDIEFEREDRRCAGAYAISAHAMPAILYDADAVDKTVEDLAMQLAKNGEPFANVFRANRAAWPIAT